MKELIRSLVPPIIVDAARAVRDKLRTPPPAPVRSGIREVERLGLRWRLDMASLIAFHMVEFGVWEKETTEVVTDLVGPGMHVLSVGANFGYYAMLMAQRVGPTGHVWAFEPTEKFRQQLQWHVEANRFKDRVTVLPFGLSDSERNASIDLTAQSASMHYASNIPREGSETVHLRRLDDVAAEIGIERIDFVSMDIDGHEAAFLRGARKTLSRDVPPIAMEFAQRCLHAAGSDVREVAALLHEIGYEICSERTRQPYEHEMAFLIECGNFDRDSNALALPRRGASPSA